MRFPEATMPRDPHPYLVAVHVRQIANNLQYRNQCSHRGDPAVGPVLQKKVNVK